MTVDELGIMLATITKERMAEILTMKMPEDKTGELGNQLATLTKRVENVEKINNETTEKTKEENLENSMNSYFDEILK